MKKVTVKNKKELVDIIRKSYAKTRSEEQLLFEANEIEKLTVPEIVNIGTGTDNSIAEYVDIMRRLVKYEGEIIPSSE